MPRPSLLLTLTAVLTAALPARGAQPLPRLVVTRDAGASSCPDARGIASRIEAVNGSPAVDPTSQAASRTRLFVEITHGLDGYRAVIRALGERAGERTLSDVGPGCDNLAEALALTLALVIDGFGDGDATTDPTTDDPATSEPTDATERPDSAGDQQSDADPSDDPVDVADADAEPEPTEPPDTPAGAQPLPEDEADRRGGRDGAWPLPPVDLHGGAGAALDVIGVLGPLAFVDGEVWLGDVFSVALGGVFVFPEQIHIGPGSVTTTLLSGTLRPCATLLGRRRALRLSACVQAMAGALSGTGRGFNVETRTTTLAWVGLGGGLLGGGPIAGPLRWSARAMAQATPRDLRFTVGGIDASYQLPRAGGYLGAGIEVELE